MNDTLARTPLHDWHAAHGARLVDFAGWSMPVQYRSIVEEHHATRQAAGVFDVSHMGRLRFDGEGSAEFLDRLLTRRVVDLPVGGIRYSLMLNQQGGILDDVLVYHLESPSGQQYHMLVVNAGNREKIVAWIQSHLSAANNVAYSDRTLDTAMIAVQGPRAVALVDSLVDCQAASLDYYTGKVTAQMGKACVVSRTGYTGEDGCELIVRADEAENVWKNILLAGRDSGVIPAGLGARDTLRLEAAMPLYGHELSEEINPWQAGLSFAVNLKDRDFLGRQALVDAKAKGLDTKRVGLELAGRRAPREHYAVFRGQQQVGRVTSGGFSPTLEKSIGMAYVQSSAAEIGAELDVDIRGRREPARVVKLPFYKRAN